MNDENATRPLVRLGALAAAALLAACAVGPDYRAPATPAQPDSPLQAARLASPANAAGGALYDDAAPQLAFWTQFGDAELTSLVQRSLGANHDLRIALANLNQARALRRETRFDSLPTITASGGYTRTLTSADSLPFDGVDRDARDLGLYRGGFDAFWELDLFGRVRRANESARASEDALAANLADAQISVAAEVARNYFELRGAQERFAVARRNAANQTETVRYAEARYDAGGGTEFDVSRARAQLASTLAAIPAIQTSVDASVHRLSVLSGQAPTALSAELSPEAALPELPRVTHVGHGEDLLRRRADVRSAERQLAGATADIGVATADLFPRVTFTGEIGFSASTLDHVGQGTSETWSYGPGITWAALDLGRVQARIDAASARRDGSLARYEQTVLRALEETENALTGYGRTREQLDHLRESEAASNRAAELARARFEGGASDFLDVLDAERSQLEAQDRLVQARTAAATGLIAVYKSLGGGWDAPEPTLAKSSAAVGSAPRSEKVSARGPGRRTRVAEATEVRFGTQYLPQNAAP